MTNPRKRHLTLVPNLDTQHNDPGATHPRRPGGLTDWLLNEPDTSDFWSKWTDDEGDEVDDEDGHRSWDDEYDDGVWEDQDDEPTSLVVVADPAANPTWHSDQWRPTVPELETMLRWIGAEHRARRDGSGSNDE